MVIERDGNLIAQIVGKEVAKDYIMKIINGKIFYSKIYKYEFLESFISYKHISDVERVQELPRNSNGKLQRPHFKK